MKAIETILYVANNQKKKTIFDYVADYLFEKYDIQYNEISHDYQISLKGKNTWHYLNINSLIIELAKSGIDISPGKLEIFIKSELISKHNPIQNYFESLPDWDGTDYIESLCSYVPTYEDDAFLYHFRKWLVRAIKCAIEPSYFNKQAFILSHKGQSSGKSTWCRFLCPPSLSEYMAEDISNDKDARIQLCRNFLLNLDELAVLSKKDVNALKAFFPKHLLTKGCPTIKRTPLYRGFVLLSVLRTWLHFLAMKPALFDGSVLNSKTKSILNTPRQSILTIFGHRLITTPTVQKNSTPNFR